MNTETKNNADKAELQPKRRNPTPTEVEEIRAAYAQGGISQDNLAKRFGFARYSIWRIIHGMTRSEAGGPIIAKTRRANAKLTEESVRAIRTEFAKGRITRAELAAKYGVSTPAIASVLCRATWKHIASPPPAPRSRAVERSISAPVPLSDEDALIARFLALSDQEIDARRRLSDTDAMRIFSFGTDGGAA